jgi:pyrimidine operon attenuation protein/uracil phosphoribosyltransferase
MPKTIGSDEIHAAIERLAAAIAPSHSGTARLHLLGIANGGIELTRRLAASLAQAAPALSLKTGTLDISFHRDDIARNPIPKEFAPTHISGDIHGATVILIDDVLFSGRTIKAALDELFDHGRPTKVELAILVDRGHRRLPVVADYCGLALQTRASEKVLVTLDSADPSRDIIRVAPAKSESAL